MRKAVYAVVCAVGLIGAAVAEPIPLRHGVGVHGWLNWSPVEKDGSYRWPPYRDEREWLSDGRPLSDWPTSDPFALIRSLGFDFVRLSVDPGPLLASEGDRRRQALERLGAAVERIASAGLKVVFDLHGVAQVPAYGMEMIAGGADSDGVRRYRAMVVEVAAMLSRIGAGKVALEPYNEPAYYPCPSGGKTDWQRIMRETVRDIRSVSRELTVVVTGACGGEVAGLVDLTPDFDDPNLYYSLHMYEPHSFTHQRPEGRGLFASGLPWPARTSTPEAVARALDQRMEAAGLSIAQRKLETMAARKRIARYFAQDWGLAQLTARLRQAVDWAQSHGIPSRRLFIGEFGAIRISADGRAGAFDADRLRYLQAVREEAERFGIPWAIWEFSNPYGMSVIEPEGPAVPDRAMLRALGLP
ncbi:cellulase family glycosylhydrolase [Bosea sp. (in: a-proteobacteria)]|uniref:glycoside hydrolase family 5 protein n=1 Tax=Bosea sp. (in: a-proteobacteria) TaxID=1871050 RepID=UPI00262530A4|nr:cellulase family glycosylhydrolase [Bosea sp. (in: a-proteobacteria)]MCO5090846.1 glycoside hydrolase family 5 protein [Bosea sp. (in: a-proteobacteria)]